MRTRFLVIGLVLASVLLGLSAPSYAAVRVDRAELEGGDLRVEGDNAVADAPIAIDGTELGQADDRGDFRIEVSGFSSPTCRITVDDGTGAVEADLDGCTPSEPDEEDDAGEPEEGAPTAPRWSAFRHDLMEGKSGRLRVSSSTTDSGGIAFEFDLGDGRTLRDPETGFHTPSASGSVSSTELQPTWDTPGEFTVVATAEDMEGRVATGEPRTVTIHPDHDDCGQQGDAADSIVDSPPLLTLPADCGGHLVGDPRIDQHDTYRFEAAERPLRLLTVQVEPRLPVSDIWLELYRPDGSRVQEGAISGGTTLGKFAVTINTSGEWGLRIGSTNLFDNVDYRLRIHEGGGGDDCVEGRGPTSDQLIPLDAPNNDSALHVLEHGQVDCAGFLPIADRDDRDRYTFDVQGDEIVALNIIDNPDSDPADHCRQGAVRVETTRDNQVAPRLGCHVEFFRASEQGGRVVLDAHRGVPGRGRDVDYRLQVATNDPARHEGDCFTAADAGDSVATATPLADAVACIGSLAGDDTEDWYAFPGENGDQLFVQSLAGERFSGDGPFIELYDPDGQLHASRGDSASRFVLDQTGQWRLRFVPDWPDGRDPWHDAYGFWMFPRRGVPDRDCGTGADTPVGGLDVALPVDCEGSFLPYADDSFSGPGDTLDRYNFELDEGDTAEVTVAASSSRTQWTARLDAPSESGAQSHWFRQSPRTFTHTATETGTYSLVLDRSPQTDSLDLGYSVAIRNLADDDVGEVELRPRVFSFAGDTTMVRGETHCLETRVAVPSDSLPAEDVTITLSESPGGAIRLDEDRCDSFSTDEERTRSVNIGGIPSPGETAFIWAIEARDEGDVAITLAAEDATGATATATETFTIVD